jgi:hypothetical protein
MSTIINEDLVRQLMQRFYRMRRAGEKIFLIPHEMLHETCAQGAAAAKRAASAAEAGRLAQQVASPLSRPCSAVLTPLEQWQARQFLAAGGDTLEPTSDGDLERLANPSTTKTSPYEIVRHSAGNWQKKTVALCSCLFCDGGELIVSDVERDGYKPEDWPSAVFCGGCGARGPWRATEELAVEAWNGAKGVKSVSITEWISMPQADASAGGDFPF